MKCAYILYPELWCLVPLVPKVNVRDEQAHPLFTYLASSLSLEGFDEMHSVA
ncbi:glutathione peroxidase-family protein [Paenibacillus polymyxa]|uniref:hypothetical protein n=1 Tax=Paenibacillus polymyxa TaxID=1406 RepID=UPI002793664C|nr:glutathione peroxidase-family protein [Paenibacillus polymyxa]